MKKKFNITGLCIPEKHFMANTQKKISQIMQLIEDGNYFTINRPRHYYEDKLSILYYKIPFLSYNQKFRFIHFLHKHFSFFTKLTNSYYLHQSSQTTTQKTLPAKQNKSLNLITIKNGNINELVDGLQFTYYKKVLVSIVIPVFNKIEYTVCCLASICKNPVKCSFEIIIVDDGSTDNTEQVINSILNIRYIKNDKNLGFLKSVNKGASLSRGKYILFLNNDTQVFANWLDELVNVFDSIPKVGMAGPKFLFPNGNLQEAGSIIKKDGKSKWIGTNDNPDKPQYNIIREVDYCSGACLLIKKELFDDLNRFDESYSPGYYEESDLAMRIRKKGLKVIYQPASVVIHHFAVSANNEKARIEQLEKNQEIFTKKWKSELNQLNKIKLIAFYLPQFHPIPENDLWWGKGFTEWTNVTKAKPNFEGHYQPQLPADLGFYDLRVPEVREEQANLAKKYGIYGFCYYYYWFNGKRLLHTPLDEVLKTGKPDFPFCICWANENWTRCWDGGNSELLMAQQHSHEDDLNFIKNLVPAFNDKRYIRINSKPLLLIYRADLLPNPQKTTEIWRNHCLKEGIGEIFIAYTQSFSLAKCLSVSGFDAGVEFPPHNLGPTIPVPDHNINTNFSGVYYDYKDIVHNFINKPHSKFNIFRSVLPSWDNTARRQNNSHIIINSTPEYYEKWLKNIVNETRAFKFGDEKIVFIVAWNEWAEGNYLEPNTKYGHKYLEATKNALNSYYFTEIT
jgi:GT2 family glycosyltransferase